MNRNSVSSKRSSKPGSSGGLAQAFLCLKTAEECNRFLRDLCTPRELKELAGRWQTAKLLEEGEYSYRDISKRTGMSVTTVGRVARFLNNEPYQGYRLVLNRIVTNTQARASASESRASRSSRPSRKPASSGASARPGSLRNPYNMGNSRNLRELRNLVDLCNLGSARQAHHPMG